jgi:hypothetical protein
MNGFAGFLGRSLRGVRLVEFGCLVILLGMVLSVYLAKAAAGRERGDIVAVQQQIDQDQHRLRLLQAEVAHLEEPGRLAHLAVAAGLAPTGAKRQGLPEELGHIAEVGAVPDKPEHKTAAAQSTFTPPTFTPPVGATLIKTGAPQ